MVLVLFSLYEKGNSRIFFSELYSSLKQKGGIAPSVFLFVLRFSFEGEFFFPLHSLRDHFCVIKKDVCYFVFTEETVYILNYLEGI